MKSLFLLSIPGALLAQERPNLAPFTRSFVTVEAPVIALSRVRVIDCTGAIPRENQTVVIRDGRIVAVGDAAHQADPLTAGGINQGMIGGDLAAQVGIKALDHGGASARALSEYEKLWHDRFGAQHKALYQIRKMLTSMDEAQFESLIQTAARLPLQEMSLGEILLRLLEHHPRLLLEATKLITTGLILK